MVIRKFCLLIWNAQTTKAVFSQPAISFSFVGMLYGLPISSELQIRFFSFIAACVLVGRGIRKGPSKPIIFLKSMNSELELSIISIIYFASWVLSKAFKNYTFKSGNHDYCIRNVDLLDTFQKLFVFHTFKNHNFESTNVDRLCPWDKSL